jgi:hypothetical protein
MQNLFLTYYEATTPELFQSDLQDKDEVQILYYGKDIVGFSTFLFYPFTWQGRALRIVFSGDTIVSREHWGQQTLAADWLGHMGKKERESPDVPLYWFLIVKGHRTYRYLDVFAREFHPRKDAPPSELAPLSAALARKRFGDFFDARRGLISFPEPHGQLAAFIAEPAQSDLRKDSVRFFMEKNPEYRRGDELVCLCRLHADNLRPMARRFFLRDKP